jgi:hypothetical protein
MLKIVLSFFGVRRALAALLSIDLSMVRVIGAKSPLRKAVTSHRTPKKKAIFLVIGCLVGFCGSLNAGSRQKIEAIDEEIEQLMDEKEGAEARAERREDEAMRWQFQQKRFSDAREAWRQADIEREREQELQEQIDALKKKREAILNSHE